ncbi:hypothetical protein [Vulcanisaeta souniana]|uniref:Uncharacterized protein n=1 Tax=Vulcanisaeta souniana JCM 11219 TaxID=1293586 RepID=A0A830E4R1_9CREN|nr:hypothetical protein [Vulcanisaeta souniana]BDR92791.1 hypothetical protein Vsou_18840 [Vulcanisaeta souniana JCM 11219]GGI82100.1 hypothetical protein GCM10007112_18560 [Vulcanisaeta souniana JCM 11219]
MSRGFTVGGIVILALLIIATSLITYMISDYLYTAYQASVVVGRINTRLLGLSRSCAVYLVNDSLYFPYGAYVEYSVPSVVSPGYYHEVNASNANGEVMFFLRGCIVVVRSVGNASGYEVLGYGAG